MKSFKGEITVFLSLVLIVLLSLLFAIIEAAKDNGADFQTECVTDMAMQSALAEYNKEALEQYELFLIDLGYGRGEGDYSLLEEHIQNYMQDNFQIETGIMPVKIRDLLELNTEYVTIMKASGAADLSGMVLERKAVDYMLDRYGIPDFQKICSASAAVEQEGFLGSAMEEKRLANEQKIDEVDTTVEDEDGKRHKVPVHNPADGVNSRRGSMGILKIITEKEGISDRETDLRSCLSHRNYTKRDGFLQGEQMVSDTEDMLFQKYLMETCGYYTKEKEGALLTYQIEYILSGKSSDLENLRTVVNRLLILREAANFVYLICDTDKKAEAESLAMTLSAVILFPELKDLIQLSILIGWAYAESVNDVKILLENGKVPLLKSSESWCLSLQDAMKLKVCKREEKERSGGGLSYEEYLHLLLAVMDREERNLRFMDLMEMDIRQTKGNELFCIDHCIHSFTAEIAVSAGNNHTSIIKRTAGYQK